MTEVMQVREAYRVEQWRQLIIVIRQAEQIAGKVFQRRKLFITGQHIVSRTHTVVLIDIGEGIKKHRRILGGRFISDDAHRAVCNFPVAEDPETKYQPREREAPVFGVAVNNIRPQLRIPDDIVALLRVHGNVETVLRQEPAALIHIADAAPVECKVELDRVDLSIAHHAVCAAFLHGDRIPTGRNADDHILRHVLSLILRHYAASFLMLA